MMLGIVLSRGHGFFTWSGTSSHRLGSLASDVWSQEVVDTAKITTLQALHTLQHAFQTTTKVSLITALQLVSEHIFVPALGDGY